MRYYYDLHIHSVLSPDADILMTPNNIFNMAYLKKMDIISITDHNSCKQLMMMEEISHSYDILFIPGIELSLKEDVHVICYFESVLDALTFEEAIEPYRSKILYDGRFENVQGITDIHDEIIEVYPYDLSKNLSLSLYELNEFVRPFPHLLVFAHIDRLKHSGLAYISDIKVDAIELSRAVKSHFLQDNDLKRYIQLHSSDAHQITDINERTEKNTMELENLTKEAFFKYFRHG